MYSGNTLSEDLCFRPVVLKVWSLTSSINVTWELVRKANARSRATLRPTESETLEWGPMICVEKALQVILMHNQD